MKQKHAPRVFSYARFSSPEQAKGDSERRQSDAARDFARKNGFAFDETLRFTDRGLSGFHGTHRKKGALKAFLEKVQSGEVGEGSILVVENIDRLGREPISDAIDTIITGLIRQGITIQTLLPFDTFNQDSINSGAIWRLIAHIERAHAESQRKSDLAKANWNQKRKVAASNKLLTSRIPAWLNVEVQKTQGRVTSHVVTINPSASATIRQIFRLKREGFGQYAIERRLNQKSKWVPEGGWRSSYIRKILRSRAVLGEFQPHKRVGEKRVTEGEPIANYFPAVIDEETWYAAQSVIAANKGKGGRTGKAINVFQNLVKCGYCSGSMTLIDKGSSTKGGKYLVCDNGRRNLNCAAHRIRYEEFQETVLGNLSKLRPQEVLPRRQEKVQQTQILQHKLNTLSGELEQIESRIGNLIEQIANTKSQTLRTRYEQAAERLETKKSEIQLARTEGTAQLKKLRVCEQSFNDWQLDLKQLKIAVARDTDTRIRLKTHLKQFVAKIEVFSAGHLENVERVEEIVEEYFPELAAAPSYPSFRRFVRKRLLSSDGRFFRLRLHGAREDSQGIPIAPATSLASNILINGKNWKFKGVSFDALAKEFFDARKGDFVPKKSVV